MEGPIAAGVVLKAADTGRILMLQRGLDPTDPAGGYWEAPGGHIDPGEHPLQAALREFGEEVGHPAPGDAKLVDSWDSPNGIYRTHLLIVPAEADVAINLPGGDRPVTNPDDPDGDLIETVAWWDPALLRSNPAVRPEMRGTRWQRIEQATLPQKKAHTVEQLHDLADQADQTVTASPAAAHYRRTFAPAESCKTCVHDDNGFCPLINRQVDADHVCDHWQPGQGKAWTVGRRRQVKYSPDQARDDHGRFGSGGSTAVVDEHGRSPSGLTSGTATAAEADRWAAGSALPDTYWHASPAADTVLKDGLKPGGDKRWGEGIYLARSPQETRSFAYGDAVPVRVNVKNPLSISSWESNDVIDHVLGATGLDGRYSTEYYPKAKADVAAGKPIEDGVNWALRQSGHDALIVNDRFGRDLVMIPNPADVKVVTDQGTKALQAKDYRDDQPRDESGRFTSGGGGSSYTGGQAGIDRASNFVTGMNIANSEPVDKSRLGLCYELAGNKVVEAKMAKLTGKAVDEPNPVVVHGTIQGFGHPAIGHAWVETPDGSKSWEPATNKWYPTPAFHAYYNSQVDRKYPADEAARQMVRTGHYGPWEGAPDRTDDPWEGADDEIDREEH